MLHLIQFWAESFRSEADIFPNFSKMYLTAVNSGVRFPPPTRSQYSHLEKIEIPQASLDAYGGGGGIWDNQFRNAQESTNNGYNSGYGAGSSGSNPFGQSSKPKSPAIQKLENDLDLFQQKIADTEIRIRRGDNSRQTQEQIHTLREFEPKLADLPMKLKAAGEYEVADFAQSILLKLQACNELINRGGNPPNPTQSPFGGFDFGNPSAPQGGDSFDAFNKAGGERSFSNNSSGGVDFGSQPRAPQGSSNIWDTGFGGQADVQTTKSPFGPFGDTNSPGSGPFQGRRDGTTPFDSTPPKRPQAPVEIDLLGVEEVKPKPAPAPPAPTQTQSGSFDLLGGGPVQPAAPVLQQQTANPFLTNGGFLGQTTNPAGFGQTQQVPIGMDPAQLRLMQINMMASPIAPNQMMGGAAGINPLLYQQMLLARQGMMGIPPQMTMGGVTGYGLGGQAPLGTTQVLGGMQTGLGATTAPAFGVNNTVSFTADNKAAQEKSVSRDPFSDLTSDLI